MKIRIPDWVIYLVILFITVMTMRDTYFYISPQAKQFESTIVDAYMEIPYPTGTVITGPFEIRRKAEHRWLFYRCKSLLTPVELTAFYDNYFQTLGAQKTVSHQTRTQRPPHPRTIVSTSYTYHTEDCVYYISFYKGDVFWTNIFISIRAAADNRLR
ncbi:hypothetical protein [Selenomonas sp.]|uniref:hypothetical protein n=1 Tax=Selenomonas sp. TaxID=2053611 RepID=UPI001CB58BEE|nr:hypothetical protein [Selenomonas sp.]MBF1693471.1 hypothetical protein [Selenomonas sp.]